MTELNGQAVPKTLGEILVEAREACQFTQHDLAHKLCLSISLIQDIENDELAPELNPLFSKGYIKSYAREVDVNHEVAFRLFEQQNQSNATADKMQSFSQRNRAQTHNNYLAWTTAFILVGFVVMIVIWWLQQQNDLMESAPIYQLPSVRMETRELEATVPEFTDVLPAPSTEGRQQVFFEFSQDCWVKVTDASNEVLAIGIKKSGSTLALTGIAPFEVTLGAPEAVTIQYQDIKIDISQYVTDKNARFYVPME